jgi:hypothetical protein
MCLDNIYLHVLCVTAYVTTNADPYKQTSSHSLRNSSLFPLYFHHPLICVIGDFWSSSLSSSAHARRWQYCTLDVSAQRSRHCSSFFSMSVHARWSSHLARAHTLPPMSFPKDRLRCCKVRVQISHFLSCRWSTTLVDLSFLSLGAYTLPDLLFRGAHNAPRSFFFAPPGAYTLLDLSFSFWGAYTLLEISFLLHQDRTRSCIFCFVPWSNNPVTNFAVRYRLHVRFSQFAGFSLTDARSISIFYSQCSLCQVHHSWSRWTLGTVESTLSLITSESSPQLPITWVHHNPFLFAAGYVCQSISVRCLSTYGFKQYPAIASFPIPMLNSFSSRVLR